MGLKKSLLFSFTLATKTTYIVNNAPFFHGKPPFNEI